MEHVIALDVGGTGMKGALVAHDGTVPYELRRPTGREAGPRTVVASILDLVTRLGRESQERFGAPPAAAGVAVPGTVDEEHGIAVYSANLGWRDLPLRDLIAERLAETGRPLPVALGHDVRTGALAEGRAGAGRGIDRFLFVALGTGIAGGIAIDGRIEAGAHGNGGEIGHVVIRPGGAACGCGQHGCLETLASASAVSRAWAEASGDPAADSADCARAVEAGDRRAVAVWSEAVAALADGLLVAHSLLDPAAIIVGGGLAEAGDTLFGPLRAALEQRLVGFHIAPALLPAALGDTAARVGAGLLAHDLLTPDQPTPGPPSRGFPHQARPDHDR
ncbi:ROK family protein [Kitasatospora sp. McL0602]|uniref:ROK family protein n=1 Tax=Kitasatospora sp. McL0602 TaxID=3439530 RepID=UPI003F8B9263